MSLRTAYQGRSRYASDFVHPPYRLFVAARCRIAESTDAIPVLLDTAAEWCVVRADLMEDARQAPDLVQPEAVMLSRFGAVEGWLERADVTFAATEGEDLVVSATWFVSPDWPGPSVIGWKGCLERMRFALDPSDESFYFAGL